MLAIDYVHPFASFWASVVGARTDDTVIGTLLLNVGRPAGKPGHHEDRSKQLRWDSHKVIGGCMEEISVAEQLLLTPHYLLAAHRYRV